MIGQVPKVLENRILNLFGTQSFRYLIAKLIKNTRKFLYNNSNAKCKKSLEFSQNGILFIENNDLQKCNDIELEFSQIFSLIKNPDLNSKFYKISKIIDYDTQVERLTTNTKNLLKILKTRNIFELISKSEIWELLKNDNGKDFNLLDNQELWFDIITMGKDCDVADWHTDTFFDSYKYWYFPYGISPENGVPMRFAKGTHLFSFRRLFFELKQSIFMNKNTEKSWRIAEDNILLKRSNQIKTFCDPHTTLIANTHGFHSRCKRFEAKRYQLHFTIRDNKPFSLLNK